MTDLVLKLPEPTAPGYLKFRRKMAVCDQVLIGRVMSSPEEVDQAIDFLISLVAMPEDRGQAKELIESLSAVELENLFKKSNTEPDPKA